jgi:hypothetical protein
MMIKYFQVFKKKPKKTYNTRMFESNWEYVTTMFEIEKTKTKNLMWDLKF